MISQASAKFWADKLGPTGNPSLWVIAIAGPPGTGKSTFASALQGAFGAKAQVLPMDGFHFDNAWLDHRDWRARKGAPHTFDLDGFKSSIQRIVATPRAPVAVPVFDRELDLSRGSARIIHSETKILIIEGNYLLLDQAGWRDLATIFDVSVMLSSPRHVLMDRLIQRWLDHDHSIDQAKRRVEQNDLLNLDTVLNHSRPADWIIEADSL